ncbi:Nodulation protein W [Thauera humireducens]|jgi:FixJ family two-component response regulator|uniref:response regulator transcription factor n=1 Tax=Thauera TaxID=33057 RepID=UPI0002CDF28D|nr:MULTISPECIES: response regulator [Thauera]ENO75710.1 LuxR family transcriptional regulator [Thauera sp. 63]CAH1746122.1 Nodulation protein W [Thauera humireducens]
MNAVAITTPTVYVVDDDVSVRESLSSLLRAEGMRVEVFASPLDFLSLERLEDFACVVLDVRMPGLDGLSLQDELAHRCWDVPIIFITGHGDVPDAVRAMRAGAIDFLKKPFEDVALMQSITAALSRVSSAFHERLEIADLQSRYDQLTPREKEVLVLAMKGSPNKVIALDLGISESTVKVHRHNVMSKMRFRSLPELALAVQRLKQESN